MDIKDPKIFKEADQILKEVYGPTAQFREGQYEAIVTRRNNFEPQFGSDHYLLQQIRGCE